MKVIYLKLDQYTIKISSKKVSMNPNTQTSQRLEKFNNQVQQKAKKRVTRFLKSKIEKGISEGHYDHALRELRQLDDSNRWVQCRIAYILIQMHELEEARIICSRLRAEEPGCQECQELFASLSQKLQNQQLSNPHPGPHSPTRALSKPASKVDIIESSPAQLTNSQTSANRTQSSDFLVHLRKNNCEFKSISIVEEGSGYRCVRASENIPKNQIVMTIPQNLLITVETAKASKVGKQIYFNYPFLKSPKHTLLATFLLGEEQKGKKSQYFYYIDILPKNLNNFPIFYQQELLAELKQTYFLHLLQQKKQDIEKDYQKLLRVSSLIRKIPFKKFQEARMIISSRIFGISMYGVKTDALVPLADMLNHNLPKMTTWSFQDEKESFVVRNADDNIIKGEQIYDSYGCKCNSRFLLNYGFIQPENPANEVGIQLRDRDRIRTWSMIKVSKDIGAHQFQQLLGYCRWIIGDRSEEEEVMMEPLEYTSRKKELQMWQYLKDEVQHQLLKYPTTIKTDKKILKKKDLDLNLRNCIAIRLGEKQILQFYADMSKAMIDVFSDSNHSRNLSDYRPYLRKIPFQSSFNPSQ